ncbi:esterase/lipase family protein [Yinghuangia soli]|uniref:Alpha/beta hydrolase n=1 Tax=Yinghuangia soli TaxID=2908204 RepID=A0AA41TYH9_9ACTN|nr:alpha/beta hydrolase [Yinghuangia soli]MCF2527833.1 alpha/beta hydrolase [Yinghuangia soli]
MSTTTATGDGFVDLANGYAVQAPGLRMTVTLHDRHDNVPNLDESSLGPADPGVGTGRDIEADAEAAAADAADPRGQAESAANLLTRQTLIVEAEPLPPGAGGAAHDNVVLTVPDPQPGTFQVLRYQDDAGLWHWRVPAPRTEQPAENESAVPEPATPGTQFVIPRAALTAPPADQPDQPVLDEGLIGAIARQVVRKFAVLVYPIVDTIADPLIDKIWQKRELASHPYGVRTFTPDNYTTPQAAGSALTTAEDWSRLGTGRTLLFVHGTFSTCHGGFSGLDQATVQALHERYEGRVIAFDHPTVSFSLTHNIDKLLELTHATGPLDVDIVAHSRGGLVARELIRRQHAPDAKYRVRKVVFAATPNNGTPLADPDHVVRFIDRYANLAGLLPGPAAVAGDILSGLMTAVQILGHAGLASLDGLCAMDPQGKSLEDLLPGAAGTEYYGISANFEPGPDLTLKLKAGDLLMDDIFGMENDLVVPTAGVCRHDLAARGAAGFPIADDRTLHFPAETAVWHSSLFQHPQTREKLLTWLTAA